MYEIFSSKVNEANSSKNKTDHVPKKLAKLDTPSEAIVEDGKFYFIMYYCMTTSCIHYRKLFRRFWKRRRRRYG